MATGRMVDVAEQVRHTVVSGRGIRQVMMVCKDMKKRMQLSRREAILSGAAGVSVATLATYGLSTADQTDLKLKYLLASRLYGRAGLAEILPEFQKTGAAAIDLWPEVHGLGVEPIDESAEARLVGEVGDAGISIGCLTQLASGPFGLQREMRFANRLGCRTIVTTGVGLQGLSGSELKQAVVDFLEQMKPQLEVAEEMGVTIAIRNQTNQLTGSADSLKWLAELRPSKHLGIALAPFYLPQNTKQLSDLIRTLEDSIAVFYAWQRGVETLPQLPGQSDLGNLDFTPLLAALRDINYQGWTEIFASPPLPDTPLFDSTEAVTAALNRSGEYLQACLNRLETNSGDQHSNTPIEGPPVMTEKETDTQQKVVGDYNPLTPDEAYVILNQGTEPAGPGGYTLTKDPGTYVCRQCHAALFQAEDKFESHCGWPSFDDEIAGAVTRRPDPDGRRVEIVCTNCGGHLGHVFEGEQMTSKNTRHCVNSISMKFIKAGEELPAMIVKKED